MQQSGGWGDRGKAKVVSGQAADAQMIGIINLVSEVGIGLAARE